MHSPYVPIPAPNGVFFVNSAQEKTGVHCYSWPIAWESRNTDIVFVQEKLYWYTCTREGWVLVKEFMLPENFQTLCLFFWEELLLVGGKGGQSKILCFDCTSKDSIPVEHPNVLKKFRKSIDDFFVYEGLLYAVDNHIHPKYVLGYRLENGVLCCVEKRKLESHAAEERVTSGCMWNDTLVMLSISSHRAGTTSFVSFYPQLRFSSYLCWHKVVGLSVGIVGITKIIPYGDELIFLTNQGLARWKQGQTEQEVEIFYAHKNLIDVYVWPDKEWWGIEKGVGGQKKQILLQGTGVL